MRLRLHILRHGVPPVQILWTVAPTRPPLAAAGGSISVSQFLDQVNDIIPLESEDWGLEDYAVEVGGYECLHFSELGHVLRDDEEVCIRALETNDIRVRRISGRHQISADGKHLIDGVAFGRPYLRRADRPAIRLPPRKRRRITYDEDKDIGDGNAVNDRRVVVRAGFDNEDVAEAEDESDDEEDYAPDDDEDEDMTAELEDLRDDLRAGANDERVADMGEEEGDKSGITAPRRRKPPKGLGLLRLVDEDGLPFTGAYSNPLLDKYGQDEPSHRTKKRGTARLAQGARKSARNGVLDSSASPERINRQNSAGSNKSVRFEEDELETPATIQESMDSDEDGDFEPEGLGESDKENAEPHGEDGSSINELSESSTSSPLAYSEEVSSDETSSSGSSSCESSSESEPDSEPELASSKPPSPKIDSSDSSDTSNSASSSSSSDSELQTRQKTQGSDGMDKRVASQTSNNSQPAGTSRSVEQVAPGEGKNRTRNRNRRRKQKKRLEYLKSQGYLGADATIVDLHDLDESSKPDDAHVGDLEMQDTSVDKAAFNIGTEANKHILLTGTRGINETKGDIVSEAEGRRGTGDTSSETRREAKRQELLTLIDAGGIEVSRGTDSQVESIEATRTDGKRLGAGAPDDEPVTTMIDAPASPKATNIEGQCTTDTLGDSDKLNMQDKPMAHAEIEALATVPAKEGDNLEGRPVDTEGFALQSASRGSFTPSSPHRRNKLDLNGAKRMLFGSLGLRTPKTKQDESKAREKLMKDVRPVKEPQSDKELKAAEDLAAIAADNSWKDKIDLRAVECCYKGIRLSTPPFPFVQRWDPQQQGGYNSGHTKKRRNKKRKRKNDNYYEEAPLQESEPQPASHDPDEAAEGEMNFTYPNDAAQAQRHEYSPEGSLHDSQAVNEQLLRETGEVSAGTLVGNGELSTDLPSLPEDPTTCTPLTREVTKKGAVIAFKQLEMSAETNWQPNISDYRTAIVNEMTDNGDLCMTPAKRDQRNKQPPYDERTGERLYSKFEMPGFNDEDNENIEISFDELINPILLRAVDDHANEESNEGEAVHHVVAQGAASGIVVTLPELDITNQQPSGFDGAADAVMKDHAVAPSREAREEISELIKDAGWRSSVQSGVNGDLDAREDLAAAERKVDRDDTTLVDPPSPRFDGFSSSPVVNVISSPPIHEIQPARRFHASGTEIAESVPNQDPVGSDTMSVNSESRSAIEYPNLPQLGDDSEIFHEQAQQKSDPLFDHQTLSQDLVSNSMNQSPAPSTRSRTHVSKDSSPPKAFQSFDASASEDEFPEPFSQAWENRISQVRDIKPESSQEDVISPPSYRKSKAYGRHSSSPRESNRTWKPDGDTSAYDEDDDEDDGASTPRPSKSQMSSQIVDLTISSDAVDPVDSPYNDDDDSYKLPKGPGWVSKTKASRERGASGNINSGKAKSKSR